MTTATQAVLAAGTTIGIASEVPPTPPTTYELIAEPRAIGDIGSAGAFLDVTPIDVAGGTRLFIPNLSEGADVEFQFNRVHDDAGQNTIQAAARARESRHVQVSLANGEVGDMIVALSGERLVGPEPDGALVWAVTGKISGEVTWTPPA